MRDPQKWKLAMARFNGYYANIPPFLKAEQVADYHGIVSALEEASSEDLSHFRIPPEKMKPKIISVRPGGYGGGRGSAQYSKEAYCDSTYFQGQVDSLKHYLSELDGGKQMTTSYDALSQDQLEEEMMDRALKPPWPIGGGHPKRPSREEMIFILLKSDAPQPPAGSTYYVRDSNFINHSPGASIASNSGVQKEDLKTLVHGVRELLKSPGIDETTRQEINLSIGTIELHLNAAQPNISIVRESLKSLRTIAENAAGSALGTSLLPIVLHTLSKLP
jgi:hypothetical protein